jgi:hypothetical protein
LEGVPDGLEMGDRQITLKRRHEGAQGHYLAAEWGEDEKGAASPCEYRFTTIVETKDRPVKVQRVALVRIDDVAGVDCPRALELDDVFLGQGIPEPRIAGRKGQNGTGVVRSDEVIEPRERAAPASGKLR